MTEYAIYKGDDLLFIGTVDECAAFRGVKVETIYWNATRTGQKRFEQRKYPEKALRIIRLEDEE